MPLNWRNAMFFSRLGLKTKFVTTQTADEQQRANASPRARERSRRKAPSMTLRRIAVLSVAAAMVCPMGLADLQRAAFARQAPAADASAAPQSAGEALRKGMDQFNAAQYEESLATLQTIKAGDLAER